MQSQVTAIIKDIACSANNSSQMAGSASGVIIAWDGYILTNSRVVHGQGEIKVVFMEGEEYRADLVGDDPSTDLAIVRIHEANLNHGIFGHLKVLKIG